ncbi:MAG: OmpA family protein [Desulfobacteraceae bacterium]|nr:OmpA family protein [Desulfobacteraceae bacterium]
MNRRDRFKSKKKGTPIWVLSFSDMMTLLLGFFILLLSFSSMDLARYKEISGSLKRTFGAQKEKEPARGRPVQHGNADKLRTDFVMGKIKSILGPGLAKSGLEAEVVKDKVILRMKDDITFDLGQARIKDDIKPLLAKVRQVIESVPDDVRIIGYTDDLPIKSPVYHSNWDLSAARAASVADFLLESKTIAENRFSVIGYGETRPVFPNDSPEHRAKNRRVEIVFVRPVHPSELDVTPLIEKTERPQSQPAVKQR